MFYIFWWPRNTSDIRNKWGAFYFLSLRLTLVLSVTYPFGRNSPLCVQYVLSRLTEHANQVSFDIVLSFWIILIIAELLFRPRLFEYRIFTELH